MDLSAQLADLRSDILSCTNTSFSGSAESVAERMSKELAQIGRAGDGAAVLSAIDRAKKAHAAMRLAAEGRTGLCDALQEAAGIAEALARQGPSKAASKLSGLTAAAASEDPTAVGALSTHLAVLSGQLTYDKVPGTSSAEAAGVAVRLQQAMAATSDAAVAELGLQRDQLQDKVATLNTKVNALQGQLTAALNELETTSKVEPSLKTLCHLPEGEPHIVYTRPQLKAET